MLEQLEKQLADAGISAPIEWNTEKPTRDGSQWMIGKSWEHNGKQYYRAWFGDYKRDLKVEWKSYGDNISSDEAKAAKKHSDELLAKEKAEREAFQLEVCKQIETEWESFAREGSTPYLQRKIIPNLFGCRIMPNPGYDPIVVVPLRDVDGKLWNYQRIYAQKLSAGDKFFVEGARIDGCFHVLKGGTDAVISFETIYVCEGFATAASIHQALGQGAHIVVAAFNANNLQHVCVELRQKYPSAKFVVCADNDAYTTKSNGTPWNVGLEKGRRAAGAANGKIVYPIFKYPAKGLTDFNDLHAAEGLERVKDEILHFENYVKGIQPMCLASGRGGKPTLPTEKQVNDYIQEYFGERIVRQDKSLFLYNGTHWVEQDAMGVARVQQMIGVAANGLLGSRDIEAYFKYVLMHCPQVPGGIDLFQPNPFVANFQNGTLHLGEQIIFQKHDPKDYLTSVLPFDKPEEGESLPVAPIYEAMIDRLWSNNADKEEVHQLAEELIGACLAPAYPMIAFFFGASHSGKSTFIKLLVKLVSKENVCSVQLCDLTGFNMETMVGKLVNFDTDVDTNRPINDSATKKLIDRMPMKVRRKGRSDVYAHLPAVHLFAGNDLPKSLDGSSHAYGKRMIFVKTEAVLKDKGTFDFEQRILDSELPGLLARGLRGLTRLHKNAGHYTVPASSFGHVEAMESDSDVVGQFLSDVMDLEVKTDKGHTLTRGPGVKIERSSLWEVFSNWQESALLRDQWIGKKHFYTGLYRKSFAPHKSDGLFYIIGLGVRVSKDGIG